MKILKIMLLFVPISFIGKFLNFSPTIMFILAALSIIPLAGIMGEGTEEISFYTLGRSPDLVSSFFSPSHDLLSQWYLRVPSTLQ